MRILSPAVTSLLGALVLAAAPARAQRLRGEVVFADSVTPARAVIVNVTDSAGTVVARTLTSSVGSFVVDLTREGRYRVRLLRIGFQPTESPATLVRTGTPVTLRLVLLGAPVTLARVTVRGERECRIRPDSAQEVFRLWDEARKALSAAQLALTSGRLDSEWLRYQRRSSATDETLYEDSVGTGSGRTARPFVSEAPASLARLGYRRDIGGTAVYLGPDGEALLSEEFAATHCFRLRPPPDGHPGWIGAEFEPARERNGIVDIAGTAWLDRASAELQLVEFGYTNVPVEVRRAGIGGRIEYARLASGEFALNRWQIRLPGTRDALLRVRDGGFEHTETRRQVTRLNVSGGELRAVRADGDESYRRESGALDVRLGTASGVLHAAGATLAFAGAPYLGLADSAGIAHLQRIPPGTYRVGITTPEMRDLVVRPLWRELTVADGDRTASASLTFSDDDLLAAACGDAGVRRREVLVFGVALDADGEPWSNDSVQVHWTADAVPDTGDPGPVRWRGRRAPTDEFGRWSTCEVPRNVTLVVGAVTESPASLARRVRIDAGQPVVHLRLPVVPRRGQPPA
ncbi:MAG: carboxypeptidase regulatory-like domain-containing protein [Gemmatimonadetes bacterium]|nr:carboxypeptidase regulatory-like domain-containing protein [Gemmatimonadota bacterium]